MRNGWPSNSAGRYRWRRLGWPSKTIPNISQHSRSCQSAPAYTGTQLARCGDCSSTSALSVMPQCFVVDWTCASTWNRPAEPVLPNVISLGCAGEDVSPVSSVSAFGAGCQSIPAM